MSELKVTGRIVRVGKVESVTPTFSKRELVIETEGPYPESIPFEFAQAKTSLLDDIKSDDYVEVSFNLRGSYYEPKDKYYTSLSGWKINKIDSNQ